MLSNLPTIDKEHHYYCYKKGKILVYNIRQIAMNWSSHRQRRVRAFSVLFRKPVGQPQIGVKVYPNQQHHSSD